MYMVMLVFTVIKADYGYYFIHGEAFAELKGLLAKASVVG